MFHNTRLFNRDKSPQVGTYVPAFFPKPIGGLESLLTGRQFLVLNNKIRPALVLRSARCQLDGKEINLIILAYQTARSKFQDRSYVCAKGKTIGLKPSKSHPDDSPYVSRDTIIALPSCEAYFPDGMAVISSMDPRFFKQVIKCEMRWPDKIPFPEGPLPRGTVISWQARTVGGFLRRSPTGATSSPYLPKFMACARG